MTTYGTAADDENPDTAGSTNSINQIGPTTKDDLPLLANDGNARGSFTKKDEFRRRFLVGSIIIGIILIIVVIIVVVIIANSNQSNKSNLSFEEQFLKVADTTKLKDTTIFLSSVTHVAGTINDYSNIEYFKSEFLNYGFNENQLYIQNISNIQLSNYQSSSLYLLDNTNYSNILYECILEESILSEDPTSNTTLRTQAWLAYASTGDITGDLIYINYGRREDYETLKALNYNLTNKIGIVRYGGTLFRGTKVRIGESYGLKGLIIYSDPIDDGYIKGDVFPNGPWRPESSFQRGTTHYAEYCPGNPSENRTLEMCNMSVIDTNPSIPAIPLSYGDAKELLSVMTGRNVSSNSNLSDWQGGLNFTYFIGGNNDTIVNLQVSNEDVSSNIYNFYGFIEGDTYPNESIIIGNHHDAWVYGSGDPVSGTSVLLEIARSFATINKNGWTPKRNIYFMSWDAEEFGLMGSTAFSEINASFINSEVVAYLNVDVGVAGEILLVRAHPLLDSFMTSTMNDITSPNGTDLYSWWKISNNQSASVGILGIGSDYAPFLNHLGIACLDTVFTGEFGTYHSVYDSYTWMSIVDPDYEYHKTMTQYLGLMAFKLVDSKLLGFNFTDLYYSLLTYYQDIYTLSNEYNCDIDTSYVNLIDDAISNFGTYALLIQDEIDNLDSTSYNYDIQVEKYNQAMKDIGKQFLYQNGLPTRYYYKNILLAPSLDTGYTGQVYPYLAYAIKYDCTEKRLNESYNITATVIENAAMFLKGYVNITNSTDFEL